MPAKYDLDDDDIFIIFEEHNNFISNADCRDAAYHQRVFLRGL